MQNKNLVLFLVLSFVLIMGWTKFLQWRHPLPTPPTDTPTPEKTWPFTHRPPSEQDQIIARLTAVPLPGGSALEQAARLATEVAVASHPPPRTDPWPWSRRPREVQQAVVAQLAASAPFGTSGPEQAALLATDVARLMVLPPVPRRDAVQDSPKEVTLGNDTDFFLKVRLTTHGAAVRQVVLNRFQAADGYGLPVWQDKAKKVIQPLELVPAYRIKERTEVPEGAPPIEYDMGDPFYHFQLYHYLKPDDDRPVNTLGEIDWKLARQTTEGDRQEVAFVAEVPGEARITKTYSLARGDYHVGLSVKVESLRPNGTQKFRYQLDGAHGLPIEGGWYTYTFRNAMIGVVDKDGHNVWRDQEDSRTVAQKFGGERIGRGDKRIQYAGVGVQYFASVITVDNDQPNQDFLEWARPTMELSAMKGQIKTLGSNSFVLAASDKEYTFGVGDSMPVRIKLAQLREGSRLTVLFKIDGNQLVATNLLSDEVAIPPLLDDISVRVMTEPMALEPGQSIEQKYLLYNGPVKVRLLSYLKGADRVEQSLVDRYEHTLHLNTLTDYGRYSFWTDLIIWFTNLMHGLLYFLTTYVFPWSYGVCIILLTVIVRGAMFPVTRRQARMSKDMQEKMQKLNPELRKLKEKYKDDPLTMYREQQELFRRHNINQFAMMGGCLPLLVQMPIFMGLYYCLQESINFRLEPFLYIRNLAAPDMLIWWSQQIPMISQPSAQGGMLFLGPYFNLLPVLAVSLMLVQQTLTAPPPTDEQQEMQMKMMKWMMVVMGLMFYKVAAGLCIYFIASSLWGLAERKLLPKKATPSGDAEGGPTAAEAITEQTTARTRTESRRARTESRTATTTDSGFMARLRKRISAWWGDVLKEASKQQQARREPREEDGPRKKRKRDDETTRRRGRE